MPTAISRARSKVRSFSPNNLFCYGSLLIPQSLVQKLTELASNHQLSKVCRELHDRLVSMLVVSVKPKMLGNHNQLGTKMGLQLFYQLLESLVLGQGGRQEAAQ